MESLGVCVSGRRALIKVKDNGVVPKQCRRKHDKKILNRYVTNTLVQFHSDGNQWSLRMIGFLQICGLILMLYCRFYGRLIFNCTRSRCEADLHPRPE